MSKPSQKLFLTITLLNVLTFSAFAAPLRVENVVRVKGQETTTIYGWGIVSGLPGTGDDMKGYTPAAKAILRDLARTGMFGSDEKGISGAKNNALVKIVVTIPNTGARSGEILDCTLMSAGNAKSLKGGVLSTSMLATSLQQDENTVVLGQASGRVTIEDDATPTVGRIVNGCRLHADFTNPYIQDGLVTLVLKREYARPSMALKIAEAINNDAEFQAFSLQPAKAIDSSRVVVRMPPKDYIDPMDFLDKLLKAEIMDPPVDLPKVTINERLGTIIIGEDVEVKPTLINHKNIIAEVPAAGGDQEEPPRLFVDADSDMKLRQMNGENVMNMKLKALQVTLDALKVTTPDMIDIIKTLHKQGAIVGEVVFVD
jgi:flagellar P-ring protein precursor FlgI